MCSVGLACAARGLRRPGELTALFKQSLRPAPALICPRCRYALVWGSSVKHRPQKVGKEHLLHDEDIVQIVKRI